MKDGTSIAGITILSFAFVLLISAPQPVHTDTTDLIMSLESRISELETTIESMSGTLYDANALADEAYSAIFYRTPKRYGFTKRGKGLLEDFSALRVDVGDIEGRLDILQGDYDDLDSRVTYHYH